MDAGKPKHQYVVENLRGIYIEPTSGEYSVKVETVKEKGDDLPNILTLIYTEGRIEKFCKLVRIETELTGGLLWARGPLLDSNLEYGAVSLAEGFRVIFKDTQEEDEMTLSWSENPLLKSPSEEKVELTRQKSA